MKYIKILLLIILIQGCESEFNFPTDCEQHNIRVEREARVMLSEGEDQDTVDEYLKNNLKDCDI